MTCLSCTHKAHREGLCLGCAFMFRLGPWRTLAEFLGRHQ